MASNGAAVQFLCHSFSDEQNYCATFHNDLRRTVANGKQRNKTGTLPSTTNMLEMFYNQTTRANCAVVGRSMPIFALPSLRTGREHLLHHAGRLQQQ
uniref:SCP domain-containing protein n=1 Tax=Globodera pallida TaxID=36090 RepID=A0A183C414_GLOPA